MTKKSQEMRDHSLESLEATLRESEAELFKLRNDARIERPEKPHQINETRKKIARLKTIMREKQLQG